MCGYIKNENHSWAEFIGQKNQPDILLFQSSRIRQIDDKFLKYFDNLLPHSTKIGGIVDGTSLYVGDKILYNWSWRYLFYYMFFFLTRIFLICTLNFF